MANWTDITRNLNTHGNFAGKSAVEQDAYFDFFAGSDRRPIGEMQSFVSGTFRQMLKLPGNGSLRWMLPVLSSTRANSGHQAWQKTKIRT